MFALTFGFWPHFAAQNRASRSNLLSCASQITLVPPLPLLIFPFYLFA
jgi:hypothetical protein